MVKSSQANRLEPLNGKIENNVLNTDERKLSYPLNPLLNKHVAAVDQRRARSKIPVLQKKALYPKEKKEDIFCDNLSAADRRYKYHQSRVHAPEICDLSIYPELKKQPASQYCCDISWCEECILPKAVPQPSYFVNLKNVLPPIKPVDVSVGPFQKISQTKSKCLLGEFTHFPALCNPVYLKDKKHYTSIVPHLPPIIPTPTAPPSSISNSLEKGGNYINKKDLDKWNICKPAFHNTNIVSF